MRTSLLSARLETLPPSAESLARLCLWKALAIYVLGSGLLIFVNLRVDFRDLVACFLHRFGELTHPKELFVEVFDN